jgi:hypothetical protein
MSPERSVTYVSERSRYKQRALPVDSEFVKHTANSGKHLLSARFLINVECLARDERDLFSTSPNFKHV